MRDSGNLLRALALVRDSAGASLWVSLIATLLFGFAASAQDEIPSGTTPPDAASESPSEATGESTSEAGSEPTDDAASESPVDDASESPDDDADAAHEGSAEPDEPSAPEVASEPEKPFGIEPIQDSSIEEILIEGSRGSGIPNSAPISVIGFDMDTLSKEGIKDIRDLANFTPSLEIKSAFAATNPAIFIRGVGLDDFNANSAGAVAIYQDGVYMQSGAIQLFGFFDEESVQVLRGPQGTYYRNASAGVILVKSREPTQEFEAYVSSTYGRFDEFDLSGAISGPIVPDILSGRVAGYWNTRDGTTKNRCAALVNAKPFPRDPCEAEDQSTPPRTIIHKDIEDRVNDVDNYGLRGLLLFTPPTLDMEWLLNVHGGQNLGHAYQYQHHGVHIQRPVISDIKGPTVLPPSPDVPWPDSKSYIDDDGDPFAGDYDINGPEDLDIVGSNLTWNWHFGDGFAFESITAYEWHDRFTVENSDGSAEKSVHSEYADTAWQFSEELNLRGEWMGSDLGDGGWGIGAFYLQEDLEAQNVYDGRGSDQLQAYDQNLRNIGLYVQSDYTIRPGCAQIGCDFKLDVGLRYNVEYKTFDIRACNYGNRKCNPNSVTLTGEESETWDGWSGDFILSWFFDDQENNVYLKYSRGWKGGHFNGGAANRYDIITGVRPEIVDSYEIGLRMSWLDSRIVTNLTGFFYDYQDLQVFQVQQDITAAFATTRLINSQRAEVYGVELDFAAEPFEGLSITFNAAWVESEYEEFSIELPFKFQRTKPGGRARGKPITVLFPFDYSGNDLIGSPRFSATGSIQYEYRIPGELFGHGLGSLTPRYSFSWKDDINFDAGGGRGTYLNFPKATFGQEAFWIHNASFSWRSENERMEITGWVHNFLDEYYKTASFDYSQGVQYILNAWADPRTYGITVTLSY
jgi:iron complex outermembrane receptor protein